MSPRHPGRHAAPKTSLSRSLAAARRGGRHGLAPGTVGDVERTRLLSLAPRLVGATALVVAGAGAVVAGTAGTPAGATSGAPSGVTSGAGTVGSAGDDLVEMYLADAPAGQAETPSTPTQQTKRLTLQRSVRVSRDLSRLRAARAWQLPVAAGSYRITATFGQCSYLWSRCHTGLDFAAPSGTPVRSVAAGSVVEATYSGAYGNRVVVALANGTHLWYCHLSSYAVEVGDRVSPGTPIGAVGSTGNVTGPHLHLEVHPAGGDDEADAVDPATALTEHGLAP